MAIARVAIGDDRYADMVFGADDMRILTLIVLVCFMGTCLVLTAVVIRQSVDIRRVEKEAPAACEPNDILRLEDVSDNFTFAYEPNEETLLVFDANGTTIGGSLLESVRQAVGNEVRKVQGDINLLRRVSTLESDGMIATRLRMRNTDRIDNLKVPYDPNDGAYKFVPPAGADWIEKFGDNERTRLIHSISELRVVVARQGKRIIALETTNELGLSIEAKLESIPVADPNEVKE